MSLDGFIADGANGGFEYLFEWCGNGDVEIPVRGQERAYRVSRASAGYVHEMIDSPGAAVIGRGFFDQMDGWGGRHPMGVPIFVVTHRPPMDWPHEGFTFVTDGLESAVKQAKAAAGDKIVGIGPGTVVAQALDAELVDEVRIDLVPVLFGSGVRLVDGLAKPPVLLEDPRVIEGDRVTHLIYKVSAT